MTYNLDTLQVHDRLPIFPDAQVTFAFPPTHHSLLCLLLPNNSVRVYDLDRSRLLDLSPQLQVLNTSLQKLFTPVQGMCFVPASEPTEESKLIIWAADWICTARLALSRDLSETASDEEGFFRITSDRFRSIAGVGFVQDREAGGEEMVLVERPYGDFVGELPPAFVSARYGRT